MLLREEGIEVIPDLARTGASNANGLAEGAVKEGKAKTRTCKLATEQLLNVQIGPEHQCLPFLVGYACSTMNRGRRGGDGRTAYELRYGKPWKGRIAEFGECVMYLPAGKMARSSTESGYKPGVFYGLVEGRSHYLIGIEGKVIEARAIVIPVCGGNPMEHGSG